MNALLIFVTVAPGKLNYLFAAQQKEYVMPNTLRTLSAITVALLLAYGSVSEGFAKDIRRGGGYKTGKGKTGTYQGQVSRDRGNATRNQSITTQEGKTYNRGVDRSYDKDAGTYNSSVTNPKGGTRTTSGTVGADGTRNESITTQSGKTYDRELNRSYDKEAGTYNSSVTNPKGGTRTTTGTVGADGTRTGTVTTAGGKTGTVSGSTVRNEDGGTTRSGALTTQDGKTVDRSATTSYDKATGTVNRTVVGPNDKTREISVTPQKDGAQ